MILGRRGVRLSSRDRRALLLGLRLITPALVYASAVKPYVASVRLTETRLASRSELLAREQSLVAQAASIPRLIAAARVLEGVGRRRMYLEQDPVTATAALSRDVARAFDAAGVSLQQVETRESSLRPDGLRELAVDIRAEGDFEGILTTIASLEAIERFVHVTRISIEGGSTYGNATADTSIAQRLTVVATIRAFGL